MKALSGGTLCAAGGAILAAFLAATIWTTQTKAPWCDEGWFASPAYNLAFHGFMGTTVLDPGSGTPVLNTRTRLDGIDRFTYWVMPLDLIAQAAWYRVIGFGLGQMRALSLTWGLLALVCWWAVFRELSEDPYAPLVALALVAMDNHFITASTEGRMDMMCSALGVAGLAVYLLARHRSVGWALVGGNVLIAGSCLTHPNGVLYMLTLLCLVAMFDLRSGLRWFHIPLAGVPYIVAVGAWLTYVARAPEYFKIQLMGNAGGRASALTAPARALKLEVARYLSGFGFAPWNAGAAHAAVVELLVFVAGIAMCVGYAPLRKQLAPRRVVPIIAVLCGFLFAFEGAKMVSYLIHVVPCFALAVGIAATALWRSRRLIVMVLLSLVLLVDVARVGVLALKDKYHREFMPAARFVQSAAAPGDLVMGSAELAFVLGFERPLLDDIMLGTTTGKSARYLVVDGRYRDYYSSIERTAPQEYQMVEQRLSQYEKIYDAANYQVYRRL